MRLVPGEHAAGDLARLLYILLQDILHPIFEKLKLREYDVDDPSTVGDSGPEQYLDRNVLSREISF